MILIEFILETVKMFEDSDYYTLSEELANRLLAKLGQLMLQNHIGHSGYHGGQTVPEVSSELRSVIREWLSDLEENMKKRAKLDNIAEAIKDGRLR